MRVIKLFVKDRHGSPVEQCDTLSLQRGHGIEGDINAQAGSPRQVLIASETTLARFGLSPGELGENFLVDAPIEHFSSGQVLRVGQALIRLSFLCEPCAALEKIQLGLSKRIKGQRGYLGMVVGSGLVEQFNEVTITAYKFSVLSDEPKERFYEFVSRIPPGRVVRTTDLLIALGVTKAHYRVIPVWMKKYSKDLPTHRIVRTDGNLMPEHLSNQAQLLRDEGIEIYSNCVADDNYYWNSSEFHELGILT